MDFFGEELYLLHKTPQMLRVYRDITGGVVVTIGEGVRRVVAAHGVGPRLVFIHVAHRHQILIIAKSNLTITS